MSWTDERVEKLQQMWSEGQSAAQIAKALGGVTRNAVIGKVHRLGLSNRGPSARPAGEPDAPEAETVVETVEIDAAAPEPEAAAPEPEVETESDEPEDAVVTRAPSRELGRREPAPMTEDRLEVLANLAEIEKLARRVTLMDLTERVCKWPIGDPTDPNFRFCGLPSAQGKPYCPAHVAVAFQPMSSRRDRDRHRVRS